MALIGRRRPPTATSSGVLDAVRNLTDRPRAAFYLSMFPEGTPNEAAVRVREYQAGVVPEWWRWKPGHDRAEPWPPARLDDRGRRLLGMDPWP